MLSSVNLLNINIWRRVQIVQFRTPTYVIFYTILNLNFNLKYKAFFNNFYFTKQTLVLKYHIINFTGIRYIFTFKILNIRNNFTTNFASN